MTNTRGNPPVQTSIFHIPWSRWQPTKITSPSRRYVPQPLLYPLSASSSRVVWFNKLYFLISLTRDNFCLNASIDLAKEGIVVSPAPVSRLFQKACEQQAHAHCLSGAPRVSSYSRSRLVRKRSVFQFPESCPHEGKASSRLAYISTGRKWSTLNVTKFTEETE